METEKLISIQLNSNKSKNFSEFVESIIKNANNFQLIEILVSIDENDLKMINTINKINENYPKLITYLETDMIKSFADAWKPLNILLKKTAKSVKFITCLSDDMRFMTKNWDKKILSYQDYYKDNIFRIRCSSNKNEFYDDIWQCGYKPEPIAFYTKEWLGITQIWNPCIGPDSFNECIAFYMINSYGKENNRDIVDNYLTFQGESVSTNLSLINRIQRSRIHYKAFFILMSYKIQSLANDKAYMLVCNIQSKKVNFKKINYFKIKYINFIRRFNFFYYRGSPNHLINSKIKNIIFFIFCYVKFLDVFLVRLIRYLYNKKIINKIVKNKYLLVQIESALKYEKNS